MIIEANDFYQELEYDGEEKVRNKLAQRIYHQNKIPLVDEWLRNLESSRIKTASDRKEQREEETLKIAQSARDDARLARIIAIIAVITAAISIIKDIIIAIVKPP
jgi:hypothetical protein